jgi:hypothetical protein
MVKKGIGCDHFLDLLGGEVAYLWRGFGQNNFHGTVELGPVEDRLPRDTPEWIHRLADQWFLENFGVRYRSEALFCTGDKSVALYYGNIYPVVPLGEFRFCWSPTIQDFYGAVSKLELEPSDTSKLYRLLESVGYTDQDLTKAIQSGSEIMLHASSYLVLAS